MFFRKEMKRENIGVIIRVRPLNKKELDLQSSPAVVVGKTRVGRENREKEIWIADNLKRNKPVEDRPKREHTSCGWRKFTFDDVFGTDRSTRDIYHVTLPVVEGIMEGYNGTILAYGQTGSGKTFTMRGSGVDVESSEAKDNLVKDNAVGITQLAIDHIFNAVNVEESGKFLVTASHLQIYNEDIEDLLVAKPSKKLKLRGDGSEEGVEVADLKWVKVNSFSETKALLDQGARRRSAGATDMNVESSRSHAIFTLKVEHINDDGHVTVGKLHLVDLAGSERQGKTNVSPDSTRFKESTHINLSLSALGNVIAALTDGDGTHVPYRNSKLTRILQNSLGGNARTLMICNVSPAEYNHAESLATLRFAARVKTIKNRPSINEDPTDAALRQMALEIQRLKRDLTEKENILQQQQQHTQNPPQSPQQQQSPQKDDEDEKHHSQESERETKRRQQQLMEQQLQQQQQHLKQRHRKQLEEARAETTAKLKSLYEKLVGGEKKDDGEAKKKRNIVLKECHLIEKRRSLSRMEGECVKEDGGGGGRRSRTPRANVNQDDAEGYILQKFATLNEELEFFKEKVHEEKSLRVSAEAEADEANLEVDRLQEAYREQEGMLKEYMRKGMLLEGVVDQLWQLTEPNCNYYDLEEVVRQSVWHRETGWTVPKIRCDDEINMTEPTHETRSSSSASTHGAIKLPPINVDAAKRCNKAGISSDNAGISNSYSNNGKDYSRSASVPLPSIASPLPGTGSNASGSGGGGRRPGGYDSILRHFHNSAPPTDRLSRTAAEEEEEPHPTQTSPLAADYGHDYLGSSRFSAKQQQQQQQQQHEVDDDRNDVFAVDDVDEFFDDDDDGDDDVDQF